MKKEQDGKTSSNMCVCKNGSCSTTVWTCGCLRRVFTRCSAISSFYWRLFEMTCNFPCWRTECHRHRTAPESGAPSGIWSRGSTSLAVHGNVSECRLSCRKTFSHGSVWFSLFLFLLNTQLSGYWSWNSYVSYCRFITTHQIQTYFTKTFSVPP